MVTLSKDCPAREFCIQNGEGLVRMKELSNKEGMYGHARVFAHMTINPGRSIGRHAHEHEIEYYYILEGEGVFDDDGKEVTVHAGDVCATSNGEFHSIANHGTKPVEMIALIILE